MQKFDNIKGIFDAIHPISEEAWEQTVNLLELKSLHKGEMLIHRGDSFPYEGIVVNGLVRTGIIEAQGQDYTLDFYRAGQVLGPYFSRTFEGKSQVGIQAITASEVAIFDTEKFTRLRYSYDCLLNFGNRVTEGELHRKTTKEIEMATMTASQRYQRFRQRYPGLENQISQAMVASYLGVTPVSLSRLRAQNGG